MMLLSVWVRLSKGAFTIGLLAAAIAAFILVGANSTTYAQNPPLVCHAAIVLDRSGSVDDDQLETMRQQITRLFQPGGIYSDRVELAFWSFSSVLFNTNTNYNAPFNGFVSSRGINSTFQTNLYRLVSGGGTNYEQGFGYDGYVFDNQVMNTRDSIDRTINAADIIVFMTDGQPNTPGGGGDNNSVARGSARSAVLKHKAAGKIIVGGILEGVNQGSLNYVINGSDTNATNTFKITTDYTSLTRQLTTIVNQKCNEILPPPGSNVYSLTPIVTSTNAVVSGTDSATFNYSVNSTGQTGTFSDPIDWSVKRVLVDRGQSAEPLSFGGEAYRDGYSCADLLALINGMGTCSDVVSGQDRTFNPGNNSLDSDAAGATTLVMDDSWPVGTKVCFILTLNKPTWLPTPTDRYSRGACLVVGKKPLVHILGGDLRVGRHFATDGIEEDDGSAVPASVAGSITMKANGRTYGSWAEYGVFASGVVVGFGSLSGLAGGYESTMPNTQEFWSKLTFANINDSGSPEFGYYTESDVGQGTIPDVRNALLAGRGLSRNLSTETNIDLNGDIPEGLYRKDQGNLTIETSVLARGKTVIIYVPEGTVTITGNLGYEQGPYSDISQLPQLVIMARNISIRSDVVNVDAWLIADSENGGTISTCDDPAVLTSQICNQQLRINGAVMAHNLELRRTAGAGPAGAAGDPAEIINLPAHTYLWSQSNGRSDVRAQTTFSTELPPYF